jgi:hypothetical protein
MQVPLGKEKIDDAIAKRGGYNLECVFSSSLPFSPLISLAAMR